MTDRIERELVVEASPEAVWDAVTRDGWLADEVLLDLRPGGDASFRSRDACKDGWVKDGWVEEASAPNRLAFWWAADGEPATRVALTIDRERDGTRLRVVETRPLDVLDLVGMPLRHITGPTFGPALVAA